MHAGCPGSRRSDAFGRTRWSNPRAYAASWDRRVAVYHGRAYPDDRDREDDFSGTHHAVDTTEEEGRGTAADDDHAEACHERPHRTSDLAAGATGARAVCARGRAADR